MGTITDWVNMRQSVDYNSEKIVKLKPKTEVVVVSEQGQFYKVRYDGKEGWIARKFLKMQ